MSEENSKYAENSGRRRRHLDSFLITKGFSLVARAYPATHPDNQAPCQQTWARFWNGKSQTLVVGDFGEETRKEVREFVGTLFRQTPDVLPHLNDVGTFSFYSEPTNV